MNGRIYDPLLGRFLSADIVVQAPGDLQAYNRYSYVWNNPLTRTDPSGFWNIWNPLTYGLASQPGENPWSIKDSSAEWHATGQGAGGGAQIYGNALTMGASDALGMTNSSAFSGSEYNGARYAGMVGSTALMVATGGTAAEGSAAARVLFAGMTAKIAGDSAVNVGEGSAKIAADPKSGEGYAQTAAGVVGLAATAVSVRVPAAERVSGEAPKTGTTSEVSPNKAPTVERVSNERLTAKPAEPGRAPIGDDGHPVELHHTDQAAGNKSPLQEMTRTDHRLGDNFAKNHPNTGDAPSKVDRPEFKKIQRTHWKNESQSGRFDNLPDQN
jgi:hypothetical protein